MAFIVARVNRRCLKRVINNISGFNYRQLCPVSTAIIIGCDYRKTVKRTGSDALKTDGYPGAKEVGYEWLGEYCSHRVLRVMERFYFEDRKQIVLMNEASSTDNPSIKPSKDNVLGELEKALKNAQSGDVVFLYYFGHGQKSDGRQGTKGFLKTLHDKNDKDIDSTSDKELHDIIKSNIKKGVNVTMALNCCFSGSMVQDIKEYAVCFTSQNVDAPSTPHYTDAFANSIKRLNLERIHAPQQPKPSNDVLQTQIVKKVEEYKERGDLTQISKDLWKGIGGHGDPPYTVVPQMFTPDHTIYGQLEFLAPLK